MPSILPITAGRSTLVQGVNRGGTSDYTGGPAQENMATKRVQYVGKAGWSHFDRWSGWSGPTLTEWTGYLKKI